MTLEREKAIKMLKAKLECMTRDVSGCDDDCNRKLCGECHLNYEQGNMGEQKECLRMSIEALEQEPIFDKIIAEIEQKCYVTVCRENKPTITLYDVFEIINKYKVEKENEHDKS